MPDLASPFPSKVFTLMTPEPTGGIYKSDGPEAFVRRYGYADKRGRVDRLNFGGIFRVGSRQPTTGLVLRITGYDSGKMKIMNPSGALALLDDKENIAAEWSFAQLMGLWNRKHAQAVYVPGELRAMPARQYRYSNTVRMGEGTDLARLLAAISLGLVYYDPALKVENASTSSPKLKRRSQFRVNSRNVESLYRKFEQVETCPKRK